MSTEGHDGGFYAEFGRRVRRARQRQRLTQAEVARSLGLTRASIANVESGRQRLLVHQVAQLAALLDTRVSQLIPGPPFGEADRAMTESQHRELARMFTEEGSN